MVYRSLNGIAPDYLFYSAIVNRNSTINYKLRDTSGKLTLPKPRTKYLKNSFGYSDAVLWNSLAIELRQASTLGINLYLTASTSFDNLNIFFLYVINCTETGVCL